MIWLEFVLALLLTVGVHERGHALVAQALGLPWKPVVTWHGPGVKIGSDAIKLTRWQIMATAAGGPLANLVLAAVAFALGMPLLALCCAEFALWNLLPFKRSDGRRILRGAA